ncbi:MAG: TlpA family protein disulfide reductase [Planctomycetaceae bacterium]|nr:TlpA family protein disulfide reductase [Planctomycetaceae bacterium]
MKNIFVTRIILVGVVLFLLAGVFVAQRQNGETNIAAAEQLDKADTVKKIEAFLNSQKEKLTAERTKLMTQATKLKPEEINKLLQAYSKFESNIREENIKAGEKILVITDNIEELTVGYQCLVENYLWLVEHAFVELIDKRISEAGIKATDADYNVKAAVIVEKLLIEDVVTEPQKRLDAVVEQMTKKGKFDQLLREYIGTKLFRNIRFLTVKFSIDKFNTIKADIKKWAKGVVDGEVFMMFQLLLEAASSEDALAADKQIVEKTFKEITDYIGSDEYTTDVELRNQFLEQLKKQSLCFVGSDLNLYGRTIDDKVFDWNSLRDKIVLVKFTASWCGPCKMELPNMREAYNKYHSKGLEIVSVYVFENDEKEAINNVKEAVKDEKISWIVLSETLTQKAGDVGQAEKYGIRGVPTMLLVGKDGKVIATETRGEKLNKKLAEIFDKK